MLIKRGTENGTEWNTENVSFSVPRFSNTHLCCKMKVKVNYVYHISKEPDVHDKEEYLSLKNAYFSNVQVEMIFIRGRQIHFCKFHDVQLRGCGGQAM